MTIQFDNNLIALAAGAFFIPAGSAIAFTDNINGVALTLENKVSVGAAMRVQGQDSRLVGIANGGSAYSTNGDDGNLAFERHEVVSAAAKLTSDLTLSKGAFGVFLRGSYVFNDKLNRKQFFDAADYSDDPTLKEATPAEREAKTRMVQDRVAKDADLLDAYLFGAWDFGDRSLAFKLGKQVINWGESTFVLHGINSILAFDQNQLRVPGFELDEVLVPTENLWVSMNLLKNVSMEAFYQLNWRRTDIDASGTYWSSNDFAGIGGTRANLGFGRVAENATAGTPCAGGTGPANCVAFGSTLTRDADRNPSNSGQWGVKLSTLVSSLNDMDLSVYAMNYHSRLPLLSGLSRDGIFAPASTAAYFAEFPEDIQLFGTSFNSTIGDWSVQGEYSYKVDQPLQIDDVDLLLTGLGAPSQISRGVPGVAFPSPSNPEGYFRGWRRFDVSQADFGFTRLLGPSNWFGYDQLILVGEAAMTYVHGMPDPSVLALEAPGTYTPNEFSAALNPGTMGAPGNQLPITPYDRYATPLSWGYKFVARMTYNNVFNVITLEPTFRFDHDVNGTSPTPITNFVEDRKSITTALHLIYLQAFQAEIGYTTYFGAGGRNLLLDRDFVEVAFKYSF